MSKSLPQPTGTNAEILAFLKNNKDGFASFNGESIFGVKNISAHVSKLRGLGYSIYGNPKRDACGPYVQYRLGTPTRRVVAAGLKALASAKKRAATKR